MPFQQIALDQSIYNKPKKSPISSALKPQTQQRGGFTAAGGNEPNRFVEEQRAQWAAEDKAKKAERDTQMQKAQELGMRVGDVLKNQAQQQVQQQQATTQQIESNPEAAAEEMWKFILTLPEENRQALVDKVFTPTSAGGTISSAGKEIKTAPKYNPIANVWLEKGYVMFDPKGNLVINKPQREFEKATFTETDTGDILNTATGEVIIKSGDIPKGITSTEILDVIKEARAYTTGLVDPSFIEAMTPEGRSTFFESADKKFKEHVGWILQKTYNMTLEEATKIANGLPMQEDLFGGGGNTDQTIVSDLKRLFDENPDEINNRKAYEDKYGAENVSAALGGTNKTKVIEKVPAKEPYKPALSLEDLKTEDIISNLKKGLSNAKDISPSKWAELSKSIDEWIKKIISKKIFK